MILKIENIIKDAKDKDYIITKKDITTVMLSLLLNNQTNAFNLAYASETANIRTAQSKSSTYFRNPKIIYLKNYLQPLFVDIEREYLSDNFNQFLDIIDTKRNYNPIKQPKPTGIETEYKKYTNEEIEKDLTIIARMLDEYNPEERKLKIETLLKFAKEFAPQKESDDNIVQVEQKYNTVCPGCGKEFAGKV